MPSRASQLLLLRTGSYRFSRCGEGFALASSPQSTRRVPRGSGCFRPISGTGSNPCSSPSPCRNGQADGTSPRSATLQFEREPERLGDLAERGGGHVTVRLDPGDGRPREGGGTLRARIIDTRMERQQPKNPPFQCGKTAGGEVRPRLARVRHTIRPPLELRPPLHRPPVARRGEPAGVRERPRYGLHRLPLLPS